MTIITQEEDFVNYNAIKRISSFTVDISESEDEEKNVYILLAFENNSSVTTDDIEENANAINGVIHLGVYRRCFERRFKSIAFKANKTRKYQIRHNS